ncbi:unnamed protein product [Sympodiomycopsis kandeliae]
MTALTASSTKSSTFGKQEGHSNDALPSLEAISHAQTLDLTLSDGLTRPISTIFESTSEKVLILIFVRHYHCGMCLQYLQNVLNHPSIKNTNKSSPLKTKDGKPVQFVVIGHGSHTNIERYAELTGCKDAGIPIYSDESKKVFKALGVTQSSLQKPGKMPEYANGRSFNAMVWDSLKEIASSPWSLMWSGGDFKQLGAEFVFDNGKPIFAHRMQNSADHTEVDDLLKVAGII